MQGVNDRKASSNAITIAATTAISVSLRNWKIRFVRLLPNTFLTPTSFARANDCAVVRLTKLIAAISRRNSAIPASTYRVGLCALRPYSSPILLLKCMSASGSNVGVSVLGHILEKVYERPFDELIKRYVTDPLKMKNTDATMNNKISKHIASKYSSNGNLVPYWSQPAFTPSGVGMHSCVSDMLNYLHTRLQKKTVQLNLHINQP
jgi:hypothetical protein